MPSRPALLTAAVIAVAGLGPATGAAATSKPVHVSGKGRGGLSFNATARRTGADRWCASVSVARLNSEHEGPVFEAKPGCGSTRDESVLALTFPCPYGVGIAAFTHGIPDRVVITYRDGRRARLKTITGKGASGRSTLFAIAVPESQLPARIERVDDGQRRTLTTLATTASVCAGPDG